MNESVQEQCRLKTIRLIRDGEPRTPTSTFTQLLSSEQISRSSWYLFTQIDLRQGSIFCNRQKCSVLPRQNSPHSNYCFIKTAQSTLNLLCFNTRQPAQSTCNPLCSTKTASTVHMQPTLFYQDSQHSPHSNYSVLPRQPAQSALRLLYFTKTASTVHTQTTLFYQNSTVHTQTTLLPRQPAQSTFKVFYSTKIASTVHTQTILPRQPAQFTLKLFYQNSTVHTQTVLFYQDSTVHTQTTLFYQDS